MDIALIAILTFITGIVGTVAGFGISTTLIPILALMLPLQTTLLLVAVIHLFSDVWKVLFFHKHIAWKTVTQFGVTSVITAAVGAQLLFIIPAVLMTRVLGLVIVIYAINLVINSQFKLKETLSRNVFGGLLSGSLTGLVGMGGVVRSAFISSYRTKKNVYIATLGIIALLTDITRLTVYYVSGAHLPESLNRGLIFFIPVSFFGAWIAQKIIRHIPETPFRLLIAFFLFLAGLKFIIIP